MSPPNPFQNRPTTELLLIVLGEHAAAAVAGIRLADLFGIRPVAPLPGPNEHSLQILGAAKELLSRALNEEMHLGNCLSAPSTVRDYLRLRFGSLEHEVFAVLLLDAQNQLIGDVDLFRGTLTQTSVYPREVVKLALRHNAAAVLFAHNHPSGSAEPSQADIQLTSALRQALALVDVRVLDHFIVGANSTPTSLAERGLL